MRHMSFLAAFLAAFALQATALPAPAAAQAPIVLAQSNQPSLFRFLFGPRDSSRQRRNVRPREQLQQRRVTPRRSTTTRRTAPREPSVKALAVVDKAEDAKRVMVIGDFFARSLAKGLNEAFAEDPNVVIIQAANGSSGLVRDDFYDWPAKLPELMEEHKPDAIVVMLGGNDRQEISAEGGKAAPGTEAFSKVYASRVAALANSIVEADKPGLWVGLVPVASASMSRGYSAFNSIYRETLENSPVKFIDVWNGFADDEGKYVGSGPDMNGQTRQLRVGDGLNFTRAGQRKLAFFTERDLQSILKSGGNFLASLEGGGNLGAASVPAISPMMSIDAVITGPSTGLSTFAEEKPSGAAAKTGPPDPGAETGPSLTAAATQAPAPGAASVPAPGAQATEAEAQEEEADERTVVEALTAEAISGARTPAGRIDDYRWSRPN